MSRKRLWKSVLAIVLIVVMMTTNAATALAEIAEPATAVTAEETVIAEEGIVEELAEAGDDESAENAAETGDFDVAETGDGEAAGDDATEIADGDGVLDTKTPVGGSDIPIGSPYEPVVTSILAKFEVEDDQYHYDVILSAFFDVQTLSTYVQENEGTFLWYHGDEYLGASRAELPRTNRVYNYAVPVWKITDFQTDDLGEYRVVYAGSGRFSASTIIEDYFVSMFIAAGDGGSVEADGLEITEEGFLPITFLLAGRPISVVGNQLILHDGSLIVTAQPDDSYQFKEWKNVPDTGEIWKNCVVEAVFERLCDVTFNMQGHGTQVIGQSVTEGTAAKEPTPAPTATGYTFGGWYTEASCVNKWDFTRVITEDITLYAKWTKNMYTITYMLDGGTNNSDNPATYDVTTAIDLKDPTRKGYTFGGWYTDSEFTTQVTEISQGSTGNKTFYAKWTPIKYTITYMLDGGTNNSDNPATYDVTTATIILQNPTRTDYTFIGWYSDSEFKTKVTEIRQGSTENKTFYAKWAAVYTVVFNGNGATGSMKNQSRYYGDGKALPVNTFVRTGYTFIGWNTKADGSGNKVYEDQYKGSLSTKAGATVTLYAQWEETKYQITYVLDGGTNSSENPEFYTVSVLPITLKAPTRKGYTFGGWYSDKALTKKVTEITKGSTGNKTFYAKWTANAYTVVFDGNGATGSMKNQSRYYGDGKELTANTFKRTGYTFAGWNTKADGSGNKIYEDRYKGSLSTKAGATVTLYAQWTANAYTVVFNGNGATGSMKNQSRYYGDGKELTANTFKRTGYTFTGWNTKADGSGNSVKDKTAANLKKTAGTLILYAQWTKTYTITYMLDGGTNSSKNPASYTVTTSTITLAKPTKTGYTFVGWYSDSKLTTKVTEITKGSTGNKKFYAKWKKK